MTRSPIELSWTAKKTNIKIPLIAKEDAIWVEHGHDFEDEVLAKTAGDVVRGHQEVD